MHNSGILPSLAVGFILLGTGTAQEKGEAKSSEKLDGKWYVVRQEQFGGAVPPAVAKRLSLAIDGDKMEWHIGNPAPNMAATITVDPEKKTIDAKITRGSLNGKTMLGIYKFEEGMLHVCWAEIDAKRPEKFASTKPGGGAFEHTVYSRQPVKEGPPGAAKKEPAASKVDFTLTSEQLAKDYETDRAAAAKKYTGKWVEVEGPVQFVPVLTTGDVSISLVGFQADPKKLSGHTVRGIPPAEEREKLKALVPGQKVKLKGKVDRETAGEYIELVPCAIVSIGPDPAIAVTADQLTEAYAADTKAADAKYKDKWVFVEGVVLELRPEEASVILAGAGKKDGKALRVSASYPDNRKKDFATLKKGDKAKIKGECGGEFLGSITLSSAGLVK
jgi:uncharacterized protein (TIGR03067 family)